MGEQFKVQYETVGASSYMTVTCPPDVPLVHFQMEMILSNDIRNFLPVTRQIIDGRTVLYYNITSRIPLDDVLEKRKLTRKELRNLLEGAIAAIHDSRGFRLSEEGIRMEPDWIFVSPGSCEPAFVFIPAAPDRAYGIRELLQDLIYKDQIEMVNDNLIQILLREISSGTFSLERLESSLKAYYGTAASQNSGPIGQPSQSSARQVSYGQAQPYQPPYGQPQQGQPSYSQPQQSQPFDQSQEGRQPQDAPFARAAEEQKPVAPKPALPEKASEKRKPKTPQKLPRTSKAAKPPKEKKKKQQESVKEGEFDREKAKKIFLLPQAVIIVALSAAVSFGFFQNAEGKIQLNAVAAAVVIIVVTEVILYREAFVNGKKKPKTVDEKKPEGDSAGERKAPPRPPIQPVSAQPPVQPVSAQPPVQPMSAQPLIYQEPPQPSFHRQTQPRPQVPPSAPYGWEDPGSGDETELWSGAEENGQEAYLEYFENGSLTRIPLTPGRELVVGRLRSEVDFAVKSPRVGKIHAKFFCQAGQYYVTDINSKNGTYINGSGQRIESNMPWPLHDKDRIMLADCEFTIRCAEG